MEKFLALLDSTPYIWKVLIPYFIMIAYLLIDICWATKQFKKDYIKLTLKASIGYFIIYGISFYVIFFLAEIICKMIWGDLAFFAWISAHTWVSILIWMIPYLIIVHYVEDFLDSRDSKRESTSSYIPRSRPSASRPSASKPAASRPASTPTATRPSTPVQRPRVVPVVAPQKPKGPLGAVNMTNYENQVAKGIDIRLDFEPNYGRIGKAVHLMKATGAKITFYNLDKIRSYDNLIHVAKQAPGQIIYERVFPANLAAISLAESGACFQCDCKDRSTAIKDIAKAAKRGGGLVTFINISWMSSFDLKELRELGGSNVEFK